MKLRPTAIFNLNHRAYFLSRSKGTSTIIAASQEGHLSMMDRSGAIRTTKVAPKLRAVSLHPTKAMLAYVNGVSAELVVLQTVRDNHGTIAFEARGNCESCFFEASGDYLWCVAREKGGEVTLRLIDAFGWSLVDTMTLIDPFIGSSCSFHDAGAKLRVSLWMAAGQDGQQVYWLQPAGKRISCSAAAGLYNTTPPDFSPDGSRFLVVDDASEICRYDSASDRKFATSIPPLDEDNPFSCHLCFLDNRFAIAGTDDGRLHLIDTDNMTIVDDVTVEGLPVSPFGWFTQLGDAIAFVRQVNRNLLVQDWKDTVALCETN